MTKAVAESYIRVLAFSASALLCACGGPMEGEEAASGDAQETVSAMDVYPPQAAMSCTRNLSTGDVNCTGSGSLGVAPYTYQWQNIINDSGGSYPSGWYSGGTTYQDWCPRGFYENGYYWQVQIQFRVLDANGYISNTVTRSYSCSAPY
jgi:hypothetical protein